MCGKFSFSIDFEDVKTRYHFVDDLPNSDEMFKKPIYNFETSMELPVLYINSVEGMKFERMKWGLTPFDNNTSFTSFETQFYKTSDIISWELKTDGFPHFSNRANTSRCIILSNGFYEWDTKTKTQYFIKPSKNKIMAFGGLWTTTQHSFDKYSYSFSIITTEANEKLSKIHYRMPLIIKEGDDQEWLSKNNYQIVAENLVKPLEDDEIKIHTISTPVNSVKNNWK